MSLRMLVRVGVLSITMTGCASNRSNSDVDWKDTVELKTTIERRLTDAMARPPDDDAFVIFQDSKSERFVQFAVHPDGIFFDLPVQTLNATELRRAHATLPDLGVKFSKYELLDGPGGKPVGMQESFQMEDLDVSRATWLAIVVFRDIYLLPASFSLVVTEG